ncbi:MAG TPA: hypothetical protein VGO91_20540 [Pyrinomonadaceae bacterium]|jgi:hypothetical protein|nr:hypothetical protein [Pyrinomonadaceae bacterium]
MESSSLHLSRTRNSSTDVEDEIARVEALLVERSAELKILREELQAFRAGYTQTIGGLLAELALIEEAIKEAEARTLGIEHASESAEEGSPTSNDATDSNGMPARIGLRKLFWSVARMFHPDHASDEEEARRRHRIMAEASRAYKEGDIESLNSLLGDEGLQAYCAGSHAPDGIEDMASRLLSLKEQLRTVEFGIKRLKQNSLYRLKIKVEEERATGRDALGQEAEGIRRKIVKARKRLAHFS